MASKGAIGAMYEQAVDRIVAATNQVAGMLDIPALGFGHLSGKRDEFRHAKELETIADYLEKIAAALEVSRLSPEQVELEEFHLTHEEVAKALETMTPAKKKGR